MIPLDYRHVEILRLLLQSPGPISAKEISRIFNVTPRIVRYRLDIVEKWLRTKDIRVVRKPGKGIYLDIPFQVKEIIQKEINQEITNLPYHSVLERVHLILLLLFIQNDAVTIKQIQYQLGVSRATITNDLPRIEDWLKPFRIELVKRQNYGCFIRGSELDIRKAILSFLMESIGEIDLWSIITNLEDPDAKSLRTESGNINFIDYLNRLELNYFNNLIEQIQTAPHCLFTDRASMILKLQIAIAINRLKSGKYADITSDEIELLLSKSDYHFTATLVEKIRRSFRISIPDSEIAYLMILVMKAKSKRPITNTVIMQDIYNNDKIRLIVEILLDRAVLYLHPALRLDLDLKRNLISHLANLMEAPSSHTDKKDPLMDDVKRVYPEAYKITYESVAEINDKFGVVIDEDEVGYLTMHLVASLEQLRVLSRIKKKVVIICSAGVATSKLLASRVITEFPDIDITGVMSYFEYKNSLGVLEHDFVITSVPIPSKNKPVIIVGPMLDYNDVLRIRSLLNEIDHRTLDETANNQLRNNQAGLSDLLTKDTIELQATAKNWQEVVERAGNLLCKSSAVERKYIQAMKSVRERFGPYMVIMPGLALLHAFSEDGVKRLCMSMVTLNTPVEFGNKEFDPVTLAFALGTVDNHSHLRSLSELIEMVKDTTSVNVLRTTFIKAKALNVIARYSIV